MFIDGAEQNVLIINVPIRSTLIKAKYSKQWHQLPSQQAQQLRQIEDIQKHFISSHTLMSRI